MLRGNRPCSNVVCLLWTHFWRTAKDEDRIVIHPIQWLIAVLIFDGNGVMDVPGDDQAPA